MGYTSDSDVRYYLSALGSSAGGIGTDVIGTYAVSLNISYADDIINMILSKRYETPFSTTPPAIQAISTTLASWKSLRAIFSNEIPSALQFVEDDYKKSMQYLEWLRDSEIDLPAGTAAGCGVISEKGSATKMWSSTKNYTPTFDVDDELNQCIDPDRIGDIADARG